MAIFKHICSRSFVDLVSEVAESQARKIFQLDIYMTASLSACYDVELCLLPYMVITYSNCYPTAINSNKCQSAGSGSW